MHVAWGMGKLEFNLIKFPMENTQKEALNFNSSNPTNLCKKNAGQILVPPVWDERIIHTQQSVS